MPFSFLNAAFLVGIAAAALPILIHLFSRRKVDRISFSSLRFLEEIARRRVRRMRLTQWIILALRVLALALLALALGRPAIRGDFAFGRSRGESAVAVVLDRSYSMQAEGERRTLWAAAADRADEVLDALEPEDTVVLADVDPEGSVDTFPSRAAAGDALHGLEPGYGVTDLVQGVRRAAAALGEATALNKELFVISDFQKTGWRAESETAAGDLMADLDPEIRIFLLPVGEGPLANTAIEDARLEGSALEKRAHVVAARRADTAADEIAVTVETGTEVLGEGRVTVLAEDREVVDIPLTRLPGEGEPLLARLSRDRLPVDDVRYISTAGTGGIPTWVVQEVVDTSPFLPLALSPGGESGRFEVQRLTPDQLGNADLSEVRLLVLDNVAHLSREATMRLRQWRDAGGVVFFALGDRVDLRHYNETLLPALFPGISLGNLLGTNEATGASYTLTPRAPGHQAFSGFDAEIGAPITGASFWRIVEVKNEPGVRTLAEFGPGLPALVQGEGAVLFASSLDGTWNNFPTHASFLPLLHQSLDAVLTEGSEEHVRVGERVEGIVERGRIPTGADLVCRGPDGVQLAVSSRIVPRGLRLVSEPVSTPGFYVIEAAGRPVIRRAVNLDAEAESDLTPMTSEELVQAFPGDRVQVIEAGASIGTPVREARYGREMWRELVVVVLLLLISEAWLSRRGVS